MLKAPKRFLIVKHRAQRHWMVGTATLILIIATGFSAQQPNRPVSTPPKKQAASGKQAGQSTASPVSSSGTAQAAAQANAQAASSPLPPLQLDGGAVLHHLNQLISWYRHATTSVQSAGLPSDAIYQENTRGLADQAVKLAFQSARAEAGLITAQQKANNQNTSQTTQQQNLQQLETKTASQIEQLQSQIESLNQQIERVAASRRAVLVSQRDALQGQLDLQKALLDALQKMASFVENNGEIAGGLEGSINQLAKSIPEVLGSSAAAQKPAIPQPASTKPSLANSGGLISEAITLYDYMSAVRQIDSLVTETDFTRGVADQVRVPLRNALRATIQESQTLANQPPATNPQQLQQERQNFQNLTGRFKQLSGAMLPLSQEIVVLDDVKTNFEEWHGSILRESKYVLRSVVLRVSGIVLALIVIFVVSEIWRRITFRYIGDPRRRRQFLVMRRVVIGVLVVIVLIFGFVSEFSSLATFAGFITAGIAVGLQAVLLSVAAYFFIIGRYGIRVGDRISVAGVTGDVVDIGLVRLYLMELAGTGVDFYPTGRIVVFSNSVLFQAGTPLFKQIPGTEYSWHEVVVQIAPQGNHRAAQEKLVGVVNSVYSSYRNEIQRQHEGIERRVDIQLEVPHPDAHLQFADTGLELLVRYPVDIRKAPEIDEEMTRKVLELVETDEALKAAVAGTPKIRSVVKG
ncbi:MAG: mechanosensitive ion channel family protein [Candidatus Sulfotelmatobacter sp.]